MNPLALEDPHEYEDISKYNRKLPSVPEGSTGEFSVTSCPAYMPITRPAAPEYSVPAGGLEQGQGSLAPVGSGSGELEDHRSRSEYENVNVPNKDEKPEATMEPEHEAVSVEDTA
jgi:hypothetical protein